MYGIQNTATKVKAEHLDIPQTHKKAQPAASKGSTTYINYINHALLT